MPKKHLTNVLLSLFRATCLLNLLTENLLVSNFLFTCQLWYSRELYRKIECFKHYFNSMWLQPSIHKAKKKPAYIKGDRRYSYINETRKKIVWVFASFWSCYMNLHARWSARGPSSTSHLRELDMFMPTTKNNKLLPHVTWTFQTHHLYLLKEDYTLMLLKFTDTYEYYYIWQKQPRVNKNYNLIIRVWNYIYVDHQSFICHSDPTQGCAVFSIKILIGGDFRIIDGGKIWPRVRRLPVGSV